MTAYATYILTGLGAGLASALLGIGGGVIMVPALILLFDMPARGATATSLAYIAPIALAGVVFAARQGDSPNWRLALLAVPGGVLGSFVGRWISSRLSDAHVKLLFALLMLVVAVRLGIAGWKGLSGGSVEPASAAQQATRTTNGNS